MWHLKKKKKVRQTNKSQILYVWQVATSHYRDVTLFMDHKRHHNIRSVAKHVLLNETAFCQENVKTA